MVEGEGNDPVVNLGEDLFAEAAEEVQASDSDPEEVEVQGGTNGTPATPAVAMTPVQFQQMMDALVAAATPTKSVPTKVTKPNMGVVVEVDGRMMVRLGGKPKADWSGLEYMSDPNPKQYRSLNRTKDRSDMGGMIALDPKWSKNKPLIGLQQHLMQSLIEAGMEQCAYLPSPKTVLSGQTPELVNAIMKPHMFSRNIDHVRKATADFYAKFDDWDKENDAAARKLILCCTDEALNTAVNGRADVQDRALVTWIKVIREWQILTREKATMLKSQILNCKISQFHGMNVKTAVDFLLERCEALHETREYDPILLKEFIRSLYHCYGKDSPDLHRWWSAIEDKISVPLERAYSKLAWIM